MRRIMLLATVLSVFVVGGTLRAQEAAKKAAAGSDAASQEVQKVDKDVVFDGDQKGEHAKGWTAPAGGNRTFKAQDKEVRTKGKKTAEFHAEGSGFHGCGWNWSGWNADESTDVSKQKNVSFWAKVSGDKKPTELSVYLEAADKTRTEAGKVLQYCPDLLDGKWHEVVVPIKDMDTKNVLNKAKVWELSFGTWSQDELNFSLFVDEIGFDSRVEKKAQ